MSPIVSAIVSVSIQAMVRFYGLSVKCLNLHFSTLLSKEHPTDTKQLTGIASLSSLAYVHQYKNLNTISKARRWEEVVLSLSKNKKKMSVLQLVFPRAFKEHL